MDPFAKNKSGRAKIEMKIKVRGSEK